MHDFGSISPFVIGRANRMARNNAQPGYTFLKFGLSLPNSSLLRGVLSSDVQRPLPTYIVTPLSCRENQRVTTGLHSSNAPSWWQ